MQLYKQNLNKFYKEAFLNVSLLMVSFSINLSCAGNTGYEDLLGLWKGEMQGKEIRVLFSSENKCKLSFNNIESDIVEALHGSYCIAGYKLY